MKLKTTVTVTVTRDVAIEDMTREERTALIIKYCTIHEIRRAIDSQLFPFDYLVSKAVYRANNAEIDLF